MLSLKQLPMLFGGLAMLVGQFGQYAALPRPTAPGLPARLPLIAPQVRDNGDGTVAVFFPPGVLWTQQQAWEADHRLTPVWGDASMGIHTYRLPTVSIEPRDNGDGTITVVDTAKRGAVKQIKVGGVRAGSRFFPTDRGRSLPMKTMRA